MDTIVYFTLGTACAYTIFYLGWQFGCWMMRREHEQNEDLKYDYYGEREFYNNYYAGSCCKYDQHHHKPKAKKGKKVSKK
jgi:hypothetical protein